MGASRFCVVVLDSLGIGALPDAGLYGDEGSHTLDNTLDAVGGMDLPNLSALGLGCIAGVERVPCPCRGLVGAYGRMAPRSKGKDTITGHWEMMGIILEKPFRTFPGGFPPEIISRFERRIGRKVLGNVAASGTEIIARLGEEHLRTGFPIVYTSADSVFQVAAHEGAIPVDELYQICAAAREILVGDYLVGRVIARPFVGKPGSFRRTERRKDFSYPPPEPGVLHALQAGGVQVVGIGKIGDIFAGSGIDQVVKTGSNREGIEELLGALQKVEGQALIFINLVDFDMLYGHRNDPGGYARELAAVDQALPEILARLREGDVLVFTADHGCDPTTPSTDHSREYVPVLVAGEKVRAGVDLGTMQTLADLGATVADFFGVTYTGPGASFLSRFFDVRVGNR